MTKLFVSTTFLICVWSTIALGFSTNAKTALVIDNTTGEVLLSKDIDRPIPPASMSKLMTLWMVFESLEEGKIELDTLSEYQKKLGKKVGLRCFSEKGNTSQLKT